MPLLKLETNVGLSEAQNAAMLAALSKITSETIGKPETYLQDPPHEKSCAEIPFERRSDESYSAGYSTRREMNWSPVEAGSR